MNKDELRVHPECPTCHCGENHLVSCTESVAQCLCGWGVTNFSDEQYVREAARKHVRQTYGELR